MKLQRAVLCANCDEVFPIEEKACPRCASKHGSLIEKLMAARRPLPLRPAPGEMTPARFFHQYVDMIPAGNWTRFADDLIDLGHHERRMERRRLVSDPAYYQAAANETMADIERQGATPHAVTSRGSGEGPQNGDRGAGEPGADRRSAAAHDQGDGGVLPGGAATDPGSAEG